MRRLRISSKGFTWIFILILAFVFIADVFGSDQVFSEAENRYLAERPSFHASAVLNGKFSTQYEAYIDDQFLWRNGFMQIKSLSERFLQKGENNGILFGKDGYLFNKYLELPDQYDENLSAIEAFAERYPDTAVKVLISPNSYAVLEKKMPPGVMNVDEAAVLKASSLQLETGRDNVEAIDVYEVLRAHADAYIYYRLDHHWTTEGAYLAYTAYCEAEGLEPVVLSDYTGHEVDDFYGTFYASAGRAQGAADTITYYDIPGAEATILGSDPLSIYDLTYVQGRDKYGLFLHNNPSQMTLYSNRNTDPHDNPKRLLVIKDSYANCFLPFLLPHYDEIEVVDLRYFNRGISSMMTEASKWDDVLILYNFIGFSEDENLLKLLY